MRDTHVSVLVIFDIPPGVDTDSLEPTLASFYSATRAGTRQCLYYGFARCGAQLLCRLLTYCHVICHVMYIVMWYAGRATQEQKDSSHMSLRSRNILAQSSAKLEWTGSKCV